MKHLSKLSILLFSLICFIGGSSEVFAAPPMKKQIPEELQKKVLSTIQNKCVLCHSTDPTLSSYGANPEIKVTVEKNFGRASRLNLQNNFVASVQSNQPVSIELLSKMTNVVQNNKMPPSSFVSVYKDIALTAAERKDILDWMEMYKTINYGSNS